MPIAHYLTLIRVFVGPLFLLTYLYPSALGLSSLTLPLFLLLFLTASELSDAFDGYFARKYNQVTDLGKILDPMADSIYRNSVFLTFTLEPVSLPIGIVFIFIYRDSIVSTLRTICAFKGIALAARSSGKIKAVIQAIAAFLVLGLMILSALNLITQDDLTYYSTLIVGLAASYALYSGYDYMFANSRYIKKTLLETKIPESPV